MASEAIAIIRKNWLAIPGLIVSLLVSGLYNFTQAQRAGLLLTPQLTDPLQLAALSIGPLSAVFFLALATGRELGEHERRVTRWAADRQAWQDDQAERAARREDRRAARREKLEAAAKRVEASTQLLGSSVEVPHGSYEDFREFLRSNGTVKHTNQELGEKFHVSTRTVTTWRAKLEQEQPQPAAEVN